MRRAAALVALLIGLRAAPLSVCGPCPACAPTSRARSSVGAGRERRRGRGLERRASEPSRCALRTARRTRCMGGDRAGDGRRGGPVTGPTARRRELPRRLRPGAAAVDVRGHLADGRRGARGGRRAPRPQVARGGHGDGLGRGRTPGGRLHRARDAGRCAAPLPRSPRAAWPSACWWRASRAAGWRAVTCGPSYYDRGWHVADATRPERHGEVAHLRLAIVDDEGPGGLRAIMEPLRRGESARSGLARWRRRRTVESSDPADGGMVGLFPYEQSSGEPSTSAPSESSSVSCLAPLRPPIRQCSNRARTAHSVRRGSRRSCARGPADPEAVRGCDERRARRSFR